MAAITVLPVQTIVKTLVQTDPSTTAHIVYLDKQGIMQIQNLDFSAFNDPGSGANYQVYSCMLQEDAFVLSLFTPDRGYARDSIIDASYLYTPWLTQKEHHFMHTPYLDLQSIHAEDYRKKGSYFVFAY